MTLKLSRPALFVAPMVLLLLALAFAAAQELIRDREGERFEPEVVPADDAAGRLRAPDGFTVSRFAEELGKPRIMAVGPDGTVFVTRPDSDDVLALRDTDGDGRADERRSVVTGLEDVHGITLHEGVVYLATVREVYKAALEGDDIGEPSRILADLPPGGRHPNRTLGVGPDGRLYVSIGSTCNACVEEHRESAAIIRVGLDGRGRELFATGLRNTIGFGWHPSSGEMWGMDHGSDWLGGGIPPEELNRLEAGRHYGWPFVNGDNQLIELERYPDSFDREAYLKRSTAMTLGYTAHAAPMQMVFYAADRFPASHRGDAFVAMHGSWNRKPPSGYEVVRIDFEGGQPQSIEPFVTGFLAADGASALGRPTGLGVAADGSLLVGDDANGVIYRVSADAAGSASSPGARR